MPVVNSPLGPNFPDRPNKGNLAGKRDSTKSPLVDIKLTSPCLEKPIILKVRKSVRRHFLLLEPLARKINPSDASEKIRALMREYERRINDNSKLNSDVYFDSVFDLEEKHGDNKFLLFYVLENYSNPEFCLDEEEREILKSHLVHFNFDGIMGSGEEDYLNSALYLLVRLTLIEAKLKQDSEVRDTNLVEEHLELIDDLKSMVVYFVDHDFREGDISGFFPDYFYQTLCDLAADNKPLREYTSKVLNLDNWTEIARRGDEVLEGDKKLTKSSLIEIDIDPDVYRARFESKQLQNDNINDLQGIVYPNTALKEMAWSHHGKYLKLLASKTDTVVFETGLMLNDDYTGDELPDFSLVHLDFLKSLIDTGYNRIAVETGIYLLPLVDLSVKAKDPKSLDEITRTVQDIFDTKSKIIPDFRGELGISYVTEGAVNLSVEVLERLWKLRKAANAESNSIEILFFHSGTFNSGDPLKNLMKSKAGNRTVIIKMDDSWIDRMFEDCLFIKQLAVSDEYDSDDFELEEAIGHVTTEISKQKGLGENKSIAIPVDDVLIGGGKELLEFADERFPDEHGLSFQSWIAMPGT